MTRALLLCAPLALVSCAKGGILQDMPGLEALMPKVRFEKLNVRDVSFERIDTAFVLAVDNPNPLRVKLSSFSWNLDLDEHRFLAGEDTKGLEISARDTSKVRVPVSVVFTDLFQLIDVKAGADGVPFAFSGRMGFDTPLGEVKIPWRATGRFPIVRMPKVAIQALRLREVEPLRQRATLAIDLTVSHQQGSAIDFLDFDYALQLGGRKVVSGLVEQLATVEPGRAKVVTLPITVDLLAVGKTIADAITEGERIDVALDGSVMVRTPLGHIPLAIDETGRLRVER